VTKDTYYDFSEPEAGVMRRVYDWLVRERMALSPICRRLIDLGVKPPKTAKAWDPSLLRTMIKNTVYKGEFYAHRYIYIKKVSTRTGKEATHKIERPREEWIRVEVPALVSAEVWEEAQRVLGDNKAKALRNAKREYLLLGLTYCADCKTQKMTSGVRVGRRITRQGPREYDILCYRCNTRARVKYLQAPHGHACTMPQIATRRLDQLVWNAVVGVLLNRTQLEQGIEKYFSSQSIETTREEIGYLQAQLTELDLEDGMLYEAYKAKAFDAEEFASKRHTLKERKQRLEEQKAEFEKRFSHQASRDERKSQILDSIDELHRQANEETPFDLKRRILLKVIDRIIVNTREEWFELEGAIVGRFDFTSAGRDFEPR
jgi:site-specific DNA recombinase